MTTPLKILTGDYLICDALVFCDATFDEHGVCRTDVNKNTKVYNEELVKFINSYNAEHQKDDFKIKPGSKSPITKKEFEDLKAIAKNDCTYSAGGSSANTLSTLKRLENGAVSVDFMGAVGDDIYAEVVKDSFDRKPDDSAPPIFNFIPPLEPQPNKETAVSFILRYPDGERSIVTYPGTAKDVITPETIPDNIEKITDVVFLQGSLWQKFGRPFAEKLLDLRWKYDKYLWLSLPTHSKFGKEDEDYFREKIIPSADVVLGNAEELKRICKRDNLQDAMEKIQDAFKANVLEKEAHTHSHPQVAFITDGKNGAYIVTKDAKPVHIPGVEVEKRDIQNTTGAGDTAFAGFLFGYLKNRDKAQALADYNSAGQAAMVLAAEKLKHYDARLPDPIESLRSTAPELANKLLGKIDWTVKIRGGEAAATGNGGVRSDNRWG